MPSSDPVDTIAATCGAVAYRTLGSLSDAEAAVQQA
jgi:hypothetical protein